MLTIHHKSAGDAVCNEEPLTDDAGAANKGLNIRVGPQSGKSSFLHNRFPSPPFNDISKWDAGQGGNF